MSWREVRSSQSLGFGRTIRRRARQLLLGSLVLFVLPLLGSYCRPDGLSTVDVQVSVPNITPRWTPDGEHIVVTNSDYSKYAYSGADIIVVRVSDGKTRKIPDDDHLSISPDVSPDGSRLVYATSRHETEGPPGSPRPRRNFEIETSDLDGSRRRRLTTNLDLDISPAWSPDGLCIAFAKPRALGSGNRGDRGIFTMNADGNDLRHIVRFRNADLHGATPTPNDSEVTGGPVWSPDGTDLAYVVFEGVGSGQGRNQILSVVDAEGSSITRLFELNSFSGEILGSPDWSPDGGTIAFLSVLRHQAGKKILHIVGSDGQDLRTLAFLPSDNTRPGANVDWSPDGANILVSIGGRSKGQTYLVPVKDPDSPLKLVDGRYAAWSPDGSRIAVVIWESRDRSTQDLVIYTMAADGTDAKELLRERMP